MIVTKGSDNSIERAVGQFIVDELLLGSRQTELDLDEPLISSGLLDSLALLQLILFIERQFDVVIGDGDVVPDHFQTIRRIGAFIERKQVA